MYTKQMLITLIAGLGLWGCETPASVNGFRDSVHQNLAVQIINPDPPVVQVEGTTSGDRMALALKRYKEGKVIPPVTLKLRRSGGGSGKSN
ncbi:MAG: hypothetical protein COB54_04645 [Alphaproteobacteria bacterium]|nr:MAG: hypothetical protein COB54_04645 [Alphaproteobacteria bacterium]